MKNLQNSYKIEAKRLRATAFVGRAITKWGAIEKTLFLKGNKFYFVF